MNAPVIIPTEQSNVVLRQLATEADDVAYHAAYNVSRPEIEAFEDPEKLGKYQTVEQVREAREDPDNADRLRLGIWDNDTFVGSINLTPDEQRVEIGYWLDTRHTGHGYATLATKALASFASERYSEVHANVVEGNTASARVLERAGFLQTAKVSGKLIFELFDTYKEPDTLAERIKKSPIHIWAVETGIEIALGRKVQGVNAFLEFIKRQTGMPSSLERPFHELLITRGQFAPDIPDADAKRFAKEARELTLRLELTPLEARWLKDMLFMPVQAQWVRSSKHGS